MTRLPETEVADEVRIRYQDYSKPEISIPGICILRPARGRDRHEGRNRNQIKNGERINEVAPRFFIPNINWYLCLQILKS